MPHVELRLHQTHTLFLVEAHPSQRRMLRCLFEREPGLTLLGEAASAEAAIEQLIRLPKDLLPELLLVAHPLPGLSGLELVERLTKQHSRLRCLVLLEHPDPFQRVAVEKAGAVGFMTKDDPDEIIGSVRAVLAVERKEA